MSTFGHTSPGGVDDNTGADNKIVYSVVAPENGFLHTLTGYISGNGPGVGAQVMKAVVYAASGFNPGTLLAVSNEVTIPDGSAYAWRDFTLPTPIPISAGTTYWIGYIAGGVNVGSQKNVTAGGFLVYNANTGGYAAGPTSTWGAINTTTIGELTLYGQYTPVGASAPPREIPQLGVSNGFKILIRNTTDRQYEIDRCVEVGAQVVRIVADPDWATELTSLVPMIAAAGLKMVLVLYGTTGEIAIDSWPTTVANQWASTPEVIAIEVANEPDINGWDADTYADFVADVYDAVNAAQPGRYSIVAGALWRGGRVDNTGTATDPQHFAASLCIRAFGKFDYLSAHLYDNPLARQPWNMWDYNLFWNGTGVCDNGANGGNVRQILDSYGLWDVPIISTESGGRIIPDGSYTEQQVADYVTAGFHECFSGHLASLFVHGMMDDDVPGYGMLRPNLTKRPAFHAFQAMALLAGQTIHRIRIGWSGRNSGTFVIGDANGVGGSLIAPTTTSVGYDRIGRNFHPTYPGTYDDVTDMTTGWAISRGKPQRMGAVNVGTCEVQLFDPDELFNPTNLSSPLQGQVRLLAPCKVEASTDGGANWYGLFEGWLRSATFDYDVGAKQARFHFEDILFLLDRFKNPGPVIPSTGPITVDEAIRKVLFLILWPDDKLVMDAGTQLADFEADGTKSALEVIGELLTLDGGFAYGDRDGNFVYANANNRAQRVSQFTFRSFTLNAPGIDIDPIETTATVTRTGGAPQVYENSLAASRYGRNGHAAIESAWLDNDDQAYRLARRIVNIMSSQRNRIWGVATTEGLEGYLDAMLGLDLFDKVELKATTDSLTANFSLGLNGATIATTDAGDDDKWVTVANAGTGGSVVYDNSLPLPWGSGQHAKFTMGSVVGDKSLKWNLIHNERDHSGRFYVYLPANPGALTTLMFLVGDGGFPARIYLQTNGKMILTDSTGGGILTMTNAIPLNAWSRVEYHVVHSTTVGSLEVKLYTDPQSLTPTETAIITGKNTKNYADTIQFGFAGGGAAAGNVLRMAGIVADAAEYPGPYDPAVYHIEQIQHAAQGGALFKTAWVMSEATDPEPFRVGSGLIAPSISSLGYARIVDG